MSNEEKKNGLQENDSPKQVEGGTEESQSKKTETEKKEGVKDIMAKGLPKRKKTTGGKGSPQRGLPKKNKAKLRPWQIVLIVLVILFIAGCATVFALYQANRVDISGDTYTTKEKTQIISSDNVVIAEIFSKNQSYVSLDQVPQDLRNALVATEDSRFYTHNGVDFFGIARSLVGNLVNRSATGQGASTITQQLARLLYLPDIGSEQTFSDSINRKFKEISIAWQLEEKYSKDQIMEMYLNEYYFGSSAYGVEEAAETYFGKTVAECNLAECAML
ncbi:MAG: biosynthetic peptidoglycan transglycosylase, partial [Eubacterium sp.]